MTWYPWLDKIYKQIIFFFKRVQNGSILICSEINNGEDILNYAIVSWLLCKQNSNIKSCNLCHSCKLIINNNHPDFYNIKIEQNKNIGIDNIREIINNISCCAQQDTYKVILIKNIEYLTEQANNALLKTLEEPPKKTFFILTCKELLRITPTIRSRCICWHIPILNEKEGICWLQKQNKEKNNLINILTALRLNNNSPISANFFLKSNLWKERLFLCETFVKAIKEVNMLLLLPLLFEKDYMLIWLLSLISDSLKFKENIKDFIINNDKHDLLITINKNWTPRILHIHWQKWLYFLKHKKYINHELFITHQLLNWENSISNNL